MGSPFLTGTSGVPPCFGEYDEDAPECQDCQDALECSAEDRKSRVAVSYARSTKSSALPIQPVPPTTSLTHHANFTPYEGESTAGRLGKNLLLNILITASMTIAKFFGAFLWRPRGKNGPGQDLR